MKPNLIRIVKGIMQLPILPFAVLAFAHAMVGLMVLRLFRPCLMENVAIAIATTFLTPVHLALSAVFFVHNLWLDEEYRLDLDKVPGMNRFF